MNAKNETTTVLPQGAVLLNTRDGEKGAVVAARFGRNGRLKGYDVRLDDGELECWHPGEFIRLYRAQHHGRTVLVTIPEA